MSRVSNLIDRIEKLARKFGMSIEEVIDILEGKHPQHKVVAVEPVEEKAAAENPTASGATSNSTPPTDGTTSMASAPTVGTNASSDAGTPNNGAPAEGDNSAGAGATGGAGGEG